MTLWGGRFEGGMSDITRDFTGDTSDRRLLLVDIVGSIAHVNMLSETGIIEPEEAETLIAGLESIRDDAGSFEFVETDEDVHTAVERRLGEMVGDVAGKLHTGRSRNDQVALDLRLYLREAAQARALQLRGWVESLVTLAEGTADVVIPTYTHLQQAQVTSLGAHFLAYAWMAVRDLGRFSDCAARLNESPLGAGASAGSTLPISREQTSQALGMLGPMPNTLDAVGSRDFVAEYVFCCAQTMVHLSRLAEELVIWASHEFGWLQLGDEVSTGSSALPQKRNPDIAELVRGRTAGVIGDTAAVLSLQKALPLAYNRDLQEDKRLVFHADDTVSDAVEALQALLTGSGFTIPQPSAGTAALPLAERLVARGVPFREAHQVVGQLVRRLEDGGRTLDEATIDDLMAVDDRFGATDLEVFEVSAPVINDQISALRARLSENVP
ncbi:MAG TPA: argininosuccinate lyase [Acidimicrobiia bacterium]|nr:argininosuccinate lyase [Acidimicrobiia bacterium]